MASNLQQSPKILTVARLFRRNPSKALAASSSIPKRCAVAHRMLGDEGEEGHYRTGPVGFRWRDRTASRVRYNRSRASNRENRNEHYRIEIDRGQAVSSRRPPVGHILDLRLSVATFPHR